MHSHGKSPHTKILWQCSMAGHHPNYLPTVIALKSFTIKHSLSCANASDIIKSTAFLPICSPKVCNNVRIEPDLQPVTSSKVPQQILMMVQGVWCGKYEKTFFNIRVILAPSNRNLAPAAAYRKHIWAAGTRSRTLIVRHPFSLLQIRNEASNF